MKLSNMARNVEGAEKGVWITGAYEDLDLLIASTDSREYKDMLQKLMKPYTKNKAYLNMSDEKFENEIHNKCIAKHILLGWKNMVDDEGNEIPYSEKLAYEILCDPQFLTFRKLVTELAAEEEVFKAEVKEEIATKS